MPFYVLVICIELIMFLNAIFVFYGDIKLKSLITSKYEWFWSMFYYYNLICVIRMITINGKWCFFKISFLCVYHTWLELCFIFKLFKYSMSKLVENYVLCKSLFRYIIISCIQFFHLNKISNYPILNFKNAKPMSRPFWKWLSLVKFKIQWDFAYTNCKFRWYFCM